MVNDPIEPSPLNLESMVPNADTSKKNNLSVVCGSCNCECPDNTKFQIHCLIAYGILIVLLVAWLIYH